MVKIQRKNMIGQIRNIPYYSGNISLSKCIGYMSYNQLIRVVKEPKDKIIKILNLIKKENCSLKRRELKHQLYSFTVSVKIEYMKKRSYSNIVEFNGFMQLDFDKIKEDISELKSKIFKKEYIACVFASPSGNGLKAIALTTKPKDVEHYKAIHKAIKKDLNINSFDNATKNAVLPMFISCDKDMYSKELKDVVLFSKEDWTELEYINPKNIEHTKFIPNSNNKEKTIRIFKTKINNIIGDGHGQVLNACLILGSRVSAGYVGWNEAERLVENMITNNNYLKKGTRGYMKTGLTYLKKGYNNGAKYY